MTTPSYPESLLCSDCQINRRLIINGQWSPGLARAERDGHWTQLQARLQLGIRLARQYSLSMLVFCRKHRGWLDKVFNFSLSLWLASVQCWSFLMWCNVGTVFQCITVEGDVRPRDEGIVKWASHPHGQGPGPGLPAEINDNFELSLYIKLYVCEYWCPAVSHKEVSHTPQC